MIHKLNFQYEEDMKIFAQAVTDNIDVELSFDTNLYAFEFIRQDGIVDFLKECEGINKGNLIYSYLTDEGKAIVYGMGETLEFVGEVDLNDV